MQAVTELFGVSPENFKSKVSSTGSGESRVWWMWIRSAFRVKCKADLIFSFCRSLENSSRRRRVAQWVFWLGLYSLVRRCPQRRNWRWKILLTFGSRSKACHRGLVPLDLSTEGWTLFQVCGGALLPSTGGGFSSIFSSMNPRHWKLW